MQLMRFKKYICPSGKAIKDVWNPSGCLYEGGWGLDDTRGCIYCGIESDDAHTVWENIYMALPYWLRQNHYRNLRRSIKHFIQRRRRGFDDSELWSLDYTIAKFIAPRLRAFIDTYSPNAVPSMVGEFDDDLNYKDTLEERSKQWIIILEKIYRAFKLIEEDDWGTNAEWDAQKKEIEEGLELFKQYHACIWD